MNDTNLISAETALKAPPALGNVRAGLAGYAEWSGSPPVLTDAVELIDQQAQRIAELSKDVHDLNWALGTRGHETMSDPADQAASDAAHSAVLDNIERMKARQDRHKALLPDGADPLDEIERLRARLALIEAQEPVAWMEQEWSGSGERRLHFVRRPANIRDEVMHPVWTALYARPVPAQEPGKQRNDITLNASQLRRALDFAAPDFDRDEDQRKVEVSIGWREMGDVLDDDGHPDPDGYVAWLAEYPEEGCIPLLESWDGAPATAQAVPGAKKFRTSCEGRAEVARFFAEHLRRHDFTRYINDTLAADFACALAPTLHAVMAAAPEAAR